MIKEINTQNIKFTKIQIDELILALDRLTRFKYPETSYYRVFSEIILKYLIEPKISKKQLQNVDFCVISDIVRQIWNDSLSDFPKNDTKNEFLNKLLQNEIKKTFNINKEAEKLVNTKLNIFSVINAVKIDENTPINLKRMIYAAQNDYKAVEFRKKYGLRFPVEKVILCEGITEEILLPKFSQLAGFDFDKNGIKLIGAGGKNQVAKLYCELKNELKIPIFVLLDADATETAEIIEEIIRPSDKIHLIKHGEFEDIFSLNLIKRTINNRFNNICECAICDFKKNEPMTKTLSEFYRLHELGDFQKADFAKELAQNLKYKTDLTEEIIEISEEIKKLSN